MALSVKLYDSTGSTIKVYATGFSSSVTKLKWYIDGSYDGTITSDDRDWPYWEFTGLAPNTKYFIKVYFYSNSIKAFYAILIEKGTKNILNITKTYSNNLKLTLYNKPEMLKELQCLLCSLRQ